MTTTTLTIGTVGQYLLKRPFRLIAAEVATHKHVIGLTGQGKSWFLASMYTQLVAQDTAAAVIDPHGDLAHDCMAILIELGKRDQVRYVDFSDTKRSVPCNVLRNPRRPVYKLTRDVLQAIERAWSALGCLTSTPSGAMICGAGIRSGSDRGGTCEAGQAGRGGEHVLHIRRSRDDDRETLLHRADVYDALLNGIDRHLRT